MCVVLCILCIYAHAQAGKVYANTDMSSAYFGEFGGRYIPETLVEAHRELEEAYAAAQADPAFQAEVTTDNN
jgi:tryptophan synthase beta subunit